MNEIRAFIHYKAEMKEEVVSRLNVLGGEILEVSEILELIIYKLRRGRVEVMQLEMIDGIITVTDKRGNGLEW